MSSLRPINDRVLIKPIEKEKMTSFGLHLPDSADNGPTHGLILAVGRGHLFDGELIPLDLKTGEKVLYSKYGGVEVDVNGDTCLIMRESDVLAVVDE